MKVKYGQVKVGQVFRNRWGTWRKGSGTNATCLSHVSLPSHVGKTSCGFTKVMNVEINFEEEGKS